MGQESLHGKVYRVNFGASGMHRFLLGINVVLGNDVALSLANGSITTCSSSGVSLMTMPVICLPETSK